MLTFVYVWVWFAFSILGFTFLPKAETLAITQNFQSNFYITPDSEPMTVNPAKSSGRIKGTWICYVDTLGLLGPKVLGFSHIAALNAEIYNKTSTEKPYDPKINFQVISWLNGSENPLKLSEKALTKRVREDIENTTLVEKIEIWSQERISITFSDFPDPATIILPDHYSISRPAPKRSASAGKRLSDRFIFIKAFDIGRQCSNNNSCF